MLQDFPSLCSQCYSYRLNYRIVYDLYYWYGKNSIPRDKYCRTTGVCVWTAASLATLITRVAAVAEVFVVGSGTLFFDPCKGLKEILIETPKNILRATHTPFMFVIGTISTYFIPDYFVRFTLECSRINLLFSRENKIGSAEHLKKLSGASGKAYGNAMTRGNRWGDDEEIGTENNEEIHKYCIK
jgi:hypothetical protein